MSQQTPLYQTHISLEAKMVDFAGWQMPLHYGSQLREHHAMRQNAGIFDISHMTIVDVTGDGAKRFLRYLFANDVSKLTHSGDALYTCMLNEAGGVVDDLICYYLSDDFYRFVVNAATHDKDLAWIYEQAQSFHEITIAERTDYAMLAVQGPKARSKARPLFPDNQKTLLDRLNLFQSAIVDEWLVSRTGYTGEDGYEIILPAEDAKNLWQRLTHQQIEPCGLGARDTLRLEAGLNLYGHEMDETVSPLEANLSWTIAWEPEDRDFIGRDAIANQKQQGVKQTLKGLILQDKGVLRENLPVSIEGVGSGQTTSGAYSPTLGQGIALARLPKTKSQYGQAKIRGRWLPVRIVKPRFVRHGKILVPTS